MSAQSETIEVQAAEQPRVTWISPFVIPLVVMQHQDETGVPLLPESGIFGGILCIGDCTITMAPAVVPRMALDHALIAVEITSFDHIDGPPICTVQATYLARDGKQRGLISPPVAADGEVVRIPVPGRHLRQGTVLATAVKVVLMDDLPPGYPLEVPDGAVSSGKRPVLVRGAWLEFPTQE